MTWLLVALAVLAWLAVSPVLAIGLGGLAARNSPAVTPETPAPARPRALVS